MSAIEVKSAAVSFPISAADSTGLYGVHRINSISAAGSAELPSGMKGKFLRVRPIGGDAQVALSFASAGQTLVLNQAAALGTGHAAAGATVKDGEWLDGIVPSMPGVGKVWLNYINVSGAIALEVWCSESVKP